MNKKNAMNKELLTFITTNRYTLAGILCGWIVGYLYWYYIAGFMGTFTLSSEWWVNCCYGAITGGFIACLIQSKY